MSLIDLPDFLTSSGSNAKQKSIGTRCTTCQTNCQPHSMCGTCQYCETPCQLGCQTQYQKCGACETGAQCGSCQHGCQDLCEKNCQGCLIYSQCGNNESSCNNAEKPALCGGGSCQNQAESCSWIVMDAPSTCKNGECSSSQNSCNSCETCQACETCQDACEDSCQDCQSSCELSVQCGSCQITAQHVHSFKVYYTPLNATHHNRFEKCDQDNFIRNQTTEMHAFTKEFYLDGNIYQNCTVCGYSHFVRVSADFEWDAEKGDDTSDIYISNGEWNRFLDLLSLKLSSANQDSNVNHIKVAKGEIITASKFNLIIDKLLLLNGKNVPSKVTTNTLILPTSHLNAIKNSLNGIRKLF